jgi:hypothetical protein
MRLLRLENNGDVSIDEYAGEDETRYAILSHRWGRDRDEVTFKDMMENTGRDKKGFAKIRACGEQARRDGFDLFWVDTCCIDKSSSAELSESINSMWHWYRESGICYAYLDDVPAGVEAVTKDEALAASKWFTRGWTLQELLAPSRVVLYDAAWEAIGTRNELRDKISEITNIRSHYLGTDFSLERASIAERMSWASGRTTKRREDIAYCLLGIFDINMPLLYGEGETAFQRLQEEIVKRSDDQSILAWRSPQVSGIFTLGKVFAPSPAAFRTCGNIVRSNEVGPTKPFAITNKGLQIELPVVSRGGNSLSAVLNCRFANDTFANLAIPLRKAGDKDQYERDGDGLEGILLTDCARAKSQWMYISMKPHVVEPVNHLQPNTCILRKLPSGLGVTMLYPTDSWVPGIRMFEGNRNKDFLHDPDNRTLVVVDSEWTDPHVLLMTFLRRDRILGDWVWDARFLPISTCQRSDLEQIFAEWKIQDLSRLPRSRKSDSQILRIRTIPQFISGQRLTTIDIVLAGTSEFLRLADKDFVEQSIVFLRSCGYQFLRAIYWTMNKSSDEFVGDVVYRDAETMRFAVMASWLVGCYCYYLMLTSDSKAGRSYSILLMGAAFLLQFSLSSAHERYVERVAQRGERPVKRSSLSWQNVRDYDSVVGLFIVVTMIAIPVGLCSNVLFGASWSKMAVNLYVSSMFPGIVLYCFEFLE